MTKLNGKSGTLRLIFISSENIIPLAPAESSTCRKKKYPDYILAGGKKCGKQPQKKIQSPTNHKPRNWKRHIQRLEADIAQNSETGLER